MTTADVSVVVPYFNAEQTIARCLQSVAAQTRKVRQVVVIDDGSRHPLGPDLVPAALTETMPLEIIRLKDNAGAAAARNAGVLRSTSRYIAFLDSDDVWLADKIRVQSELMEQFDHHITGHGYLPLWLGEPETPASPPPRLRRITRLDFLWGNPFFTPTVMVRRDRFQGFDARFRRVDDYKAWFETVAAGPACRLEVALAAGFKPALGHSGLTASAVAMHRSYQQVLRALLDERLMTTVEYGVAMAVESLKYPVRCLRMAAARELPRVRG